MSDFVSGTTYLAQGQPYALGDRMQTDRSTDPDALARAQDQFRAFLKANGTAGRSAALAPQDGVKLAPYGGERRLRGVALASAAGDIDVSGVRRVNGAAVVFRATFTNHAATRSPQFVPLLVVANEHGLELGETAAAARTLAPGESAAITWQPDLRKVVPGTYFVSVLPSHPDTGRSLGVGQYHVEAKL